MLRITVDPKQADIGVDDLCEKRQLKAAGASTAKAGDKDQPDKRGSGLPMAVWLIGLAGVAMLIGFLVLRMLRQRDEA